ncbi:MULTISPECIES: TetR/AcrR family transcriptional regulator [unclassified Mycolicibacterium]|uniref:TetR/AcrR family transcriptional regulator n=1 Tax=unclassified Mycolicibacterium TaxID=2636767 RepID=UPI0012DCD0AA|nr:MULTISPECIES: TetR/AcrR family transcriptional regulator [unclassified Mycolicibacterium]MUL82205.1 TetR family transcriptional regulator [Mycolicibacterium sp. CBMA 329]MUL87971.1 TetR family transcriptional regulator [Mycolicibacterium sp. CBMA 331]MUM02302.1 TetR family transcriptional regulator [Mycolicibacterium sp. CBMA 334]MUM26386.1 TetR family transcriptional regulator [Mycolicibacterium sp. CBMA 295]MUM38268.1 TetR family transcriptional regulator [Mycolicibacterium sp. CBMA 247]
MLGQDGARGVSHPKVDKKAGVPDGTTSFYFRTRKALMHAIAARLNELDLADLSLLTELTDADPTEFAGTVGFATLVMYSATEPWLTRAKARYELALEAGRDAELAATLNESVEGFYGLARAVVTEWHSTNENPMAPDVVDDQAKTLFSFVNGVMMTFVIGQPLVEDADQLDRLIRGVLSGWPVDGITPPGNECYEGSD